MKKIFTLLMVMIMICSTLANVQANSNTVNGNNNTIIFIDVPNDYWAKNEIQYFASQNIVSGVGDGKFEPESGVTREQFAKMLVLTFHAALSTPTEPTFADISKDRWSYPYVETCKEFLTGYTNPFGGKPTFHAEEFATREDIAVALVRIMSLTDNDVKDANYAKKKFTDADSISPSLLKYVSLAAEKGLINGYPDGSFSSTKSITRAEAVVLLNRATKQAVTNINSELEVSANVVTGNDPKEVTIMIETEEGAKVTVDGQTINMSNNGYDKYEGAYPYKFAEEGTKTFRVEVSKAGKVKVIEVTAKYEIGVPVLNITMCPTNSETKLVKINGTVKDANDTRPIVTINGEQVNVFGVSWEKTVELKEGENTFEIIATNSLGKTTRETRTITFGVSAPILSITQCPTNSEFKTAKINGTVKDTNDTRPTVTINNQSVPVYSGIWEKTVELKEGENTFEIIATNNLGKTTKVTKIITFGVSAPILSITQCPANSENKTAKINGTLKDTNDTRPTLSINGKRVDVWSGSWEVTIELKEGENTFEIVATNNLGKVTKVTKSINFTPGAPEIMFTNCPEVTNQKNLNIQGRIKGETDGLKLYINDQEISMGSSKEFSKSVTLSDGENTFTFRAVNSFGKSVSVVKTIKFTEIKTPEIKIN